VASFQRRPLLPNLAKDRNSMASYLGVSSDLKKDLRNILTLLTVNSRVACTQVYRCFTSFVLTCL
jgi:hypothetical protein